MAVVERRDGGAGRPADEILDECTRLARAGVREITLLGQTVNSWYEPGQKPQSRLSASGSAFAALVRAIVEAAPTLARIRYTSPHPRHLTPSLVEAHAELPQLCAHLHLPVQSGSLVRMNGRRVAEDSVNLT